MKFYKSLLKFIQIFIVLVVLPRVASFVGLLGHNEAGFDLHDVIRFAFAITLGLGTVASAYFSDDTEAPEYDDEPTNARERKRREREAVYFASMQNASPYARRALYIFAFLDGSFNLADALYGASLSGLIDVAVNGNLAYVYMVATFIFGVSPTMLAIFLAKLISMVDRIPADYERPVNRRQLDLLRTIMGNLGLREYSASDAAALMSNTEPVRQTPNTEHRTEHRAPNRIPTGEQGTRVMMWLEQNADPNNPPSITEIQQALDEPIPSRSTVSVARADWRQRRQLREYDPFRT